MKHFLTIFRLFFLAVILFSACKKEEDPTNNTSTSTNSSDGYITFYTKSDAEGCGDITISLNSSSIGSLSDSTTTTPTCQASNGAGVLSIGVDIGSHDYSASDNCSNIWTGTIIINKGDCKTKELTR